MKWFVLAALLACMTPSADAEDLPASWFLAGPHPKDYMVSMDSKHAYSGSASALLESKSENARGFGTLMQQSAPGIYSGKRVCMTGYVRCEDVKNWSGLWFRVDGEEGKRLAFDNMSDRPIRESSEWKQYHIVLEVPEEAVALAYGVLLNGAGRVWVDDISFEVVDESVPITRQSHALPSAPANLDFEK